PVVEQTDDIQIPEDEIRVDVFRSSGPGGQGVNTTDSAVRLTHLPTGIVVSCQNERSQIQNRASAMVVLQAKLLERRRQEEDEQMQALRGDGGRAWGTQIRNYVLYPYQNVKDVRTGMETGNAVAVLDGEIDGFIDAEIRWMRQNGRELPTELGDEQQDGQHQDDGDQQLRPDGEVVVNVLPGGATRRAPSLDHGSGAVSADQVFAA